MKVRIIIVMDAPDDVPLVDWADDLQAEMEAHQDWVGIENGEVEVTITKYPEDSTRV